MRGRAPLRQRGTSRVLARKRWIWVIAGGLAFGALAGLLGSSGSATHILMLGIVLLPLLLWKRPYLSPAVLLSAAILVEQGAPGPHIPITGKIPMFAGIGPGHLQGADLLLLMVLFIYFVRAGEWGPRWLPRTHVSLAIRSVLACVVLGIAIGQLHHGSLRVALMEARPYVYLASTYFLAAVFIRDRRAIRAMLTAFVGSVAFKAVQGIYVWVENRHMYPKPESFITHEASYFFVIYMMLVLTLWLFDQKGNLRKWSTRLLPLVIFANTVNDRRAAWEMLGGALLCFGVITYKALPIRRHVLGKAIVGLILVSAVYFPVMWNSSSSLGMPARAIKSQIAPSARDADSDTYRVQENANLELNIKQDGPLGKGFGVKIDYALPITDISNTDPLIAYIPHNDVLDVLMRMGLLGGIAMWGLIAAAIIMGCRMAMSKDRETAIIGMLLACSIVAYALMGAVDQGFYFYRIAFITGSLLGMAEAARRLAREESVEILPGQPVLSPLAHLPAIAAGRPRPAQIAPAKRTVLPARRVAAPAEVKLELLSLIHRLPETEEQAILELIERWGWTGRTLHRRGGGADPGTVFASPATLLHVGLTHRVMLDDEPIWASLVAAPDLERGGALPAALVDVAAREWIGYLLGTGRSNSPTKLLLAAALVEQRLDLARGAGAPVVGAPSAVVEPVTNTHRLRHVNAPHPAHIARLFSYLTGEVPDLGRLRDPDGLRTELARIRRAHSEIHLQAFVGDGPKR